MAQLSWLGGPEETKAGGLDFDEIYQLYPRKRGKKRGMELARRKICSQAALENLKRAVQNYADECKEEQRDERYIQYFDTFMGEWEDWISPEKTQEEKFDIGRILVEKGVGA